jgi:hypothetical protein
LAKDFKEYFRKGIVLFAAVFCENQFCVNIFKNSPEEILFFEIGPIGYSREIDAGKKC